MGVTLARRMRFPVESSTPSGSISRQRDAESETAGIDVGDDDEAVHAYVPMPYVAPQTERELEDYAAACAKTQNIYCRCTSNCWL